jgi:DNA-binding transcriptional MerR regulator
MKSYVTTGAAARELGISTATLTRWVKAGTVTPAQTTAGGHYRWDLAVLREQLRRVSKPSNEQVTTEDILRVVHAANREWQIVTGDPKPSPPWDDASDYEVSTGMATVAAALADPAMTPEQNHQRWMDHLVSEGWRWGEVKDEQAKTHPDLVPFHELPEHEKQKDRLFIGIVRALAPE